MSGPAGPEPSQSPPAGAAGRRDLLRDLLLRVAGGAVAFAGGLLAAVMALLLVPLNLALGEIVLPLPAAVVLAVVGNGVLLWFARAATGVRWGVLAPATGWFLVMVPALGSTDAGSRLLLPDDWVAVLTLFGGTIVLTIGAVISLTTSKRVSSALPIDPARLSRQLR